LVANCPHGFPSDQCLICRTLGTGPGGAAGGEGKRRTRTKGKTAPSPVGLLEGNRPAPGGLAPAPSSDLALQGGRGGRSWGWALVAVVVVGGILVWAFGGLVHLALHIAELVAVAAASGWAGYRLGHVRGRHQARAEERGSGRRR
jgi:hypothetical protein